MLAAPLGQQIGQGQADKGPSLSVVIGVALALGAGALTLTTGDRFKPDDRQSPVAAVEALKQLGVVRVLNDNDFGAYLIANGVEPYINGRTELHGEATMVAHNHFSGATNPDDFFRLIADRRVEARLLRT